MDPERLVLMKLNPRYFVSIMFPKRNFFAMQHSHAGKHLFLTLLAMLASWLIFAGSLAGLRQDRFVRPAADHLLRLRILPEDNSSEAQEEKLRVRDAVLAQLAAALPPDADRSQVEDYILTHSGALENTVKSALSGNERSFSLSLTDCWFPEKTYGDCTFPAGNYDALRITIGEAKGKNWWCVLFPSLCFVDTVHGVVPEEPKELLKNVLTEEEYESLFTPGKSEYKVRWKAAEIWQSLFG